MCGLRSPTPCEEGWGRGRLRLQLSACMVRRRRPAAETPHSGPSPHEGARCPKRILLKPPGWDRRAVGRARMLWRKTAVLASQLNERRTRAPRRATGRAQRGPLCRSMSSVPTRGSVMMSFGPVTGKAATGSREDSASSITLPNVSLVTLGKTEDVGGRHSASAERLDRQPAEEVRLRVGRASARSPGRSLADDDLAAGQDRASGTPRRFFSTATRPTQRKTRARQLQVGLRRAAGTASWSTPRDQQQQIVESRVR